MAQAEERILDARGPNGERAQIIWVLEANRQAVPGTAESCRDFMDSQGSDKGFCVGDGQTMPDARAWDRGDVAIGRGFDLILTRSDMMIQWTSTHGTPGGNDNLTGDDILAEVQAVLDSL